MSKKILVLTFFGLMLTCGDVYAQELSQASDDKTLFNLDVTEIVTTALVLGFSYATLQGFESRK